MRRPGILLAAVLAAFAVPAVAHVQRSHLDVKVLGTIPAPGTPASLAVAPDGTIFTATYGHAPGDTGLSRIWQIAPDGKVARNWPVAYQDPSGEHGASIAGIDADGRVLFVDQRPARVVIQDPKSGKQTPYADIPDLPSCSGAPDGSCSPTRTDLPPSPNHSVFASDGTLYVTDRQQAVVWRIPKSGGDPTVWAADARWDNGPYGLSGIAWLPGRAKLLVGSFGNLSESPESRLYTVPVGPGGEAGRPEIAWSGAPGTWPDGFAVAASGNVYAALIGVNQLLELAPDMTERARIPATPAQNLMQEVPFDQPAAVAFSGERLIVANSSYAAHDPSHYVLFDVFAGEPGLEIPRPKLLPPPLAPRPAGATPGSAPLRTMSVRVAPRKLKAKRTARVSVAISFREGQDDLPVADALVSALGRKARTNAAGRATLKLKPKKAGNVVLTVAREGFAPARLTIRVTRR